MHLKHKWSPWSGVRMRNMQLVLSGGHSVPWIKRYQTRVCINPKCGKIQEKDL